MNIAICISGQMRTALHAAPNIKRFIGELLPNVDFFIHTWDVNKYKRYGHVNGLPPSHRPLTPIVVNRPSVELSSTDIDSYKETYNPVSMSVESYKKFEAMYSTAGRKRVPLDSCLFYSWRRSVMQCVEHSITTGKTYDVILKIRPDIVYASYRRLSVELDAFSEDTAAFYVDNFSETAFEDVTWLASANNMVSAAGFGDPMFDLDCGLRRYVDYLKIPMKSMQQHGYAPLRPESVRYDPLTQFKEIYDSDTYWYSDGENPPGWPDCVDS